MQEVQYRLYPSLKGPKFLCGAKYGFCSSNFPYCWGKYTPYGYLGPFGFLFQSFERAHGCCYNPKAPEDYHVSYARPSWPAVADQSLRGCVRPELNPCFRVISVVAARLVRCCYGPWVPILSPNSCTLNRCILQRLKPSMYTRRCSSMDGPDHAILASGFHERVIWGWGYRKM